MTIPTRSGGSNGEDDGDRGNREGRLNVPRRRFLGLTGGALALSAFASTTPSAADGESVKDRPTLYWPDERTAARENVENYEWAADVRDRVVTSADAYLDSYGDLEEFWSLVTSQQIPRSSSVSPAGSPITGTELDREYGVYGWAAVPADSVEDPREPGAYQTLFDVVTPTIDIGGSGYDFPWKPWKLLDPTSGYVFPTNDFAAYRESGRDAEGKFDPELADDSLLVNELYPDKPDDWGVDDGTGWVDDDGNVYTFVAYYNHFYVWYVLRFMARVFRDAYLLSADPKYARTATVILDRIADVYPELDISGYAPDGPFSNSHGGSGQGKAVGCIWENDQIQAFMSCYDAVFPGQEGDDELLRFLGEKANQYDIGDKSSIDQVRRNVDENVVKEVLPMVQDAQIRGNFGSHQSSLSMSAVVADEPDGYTADAIDFLFQAGGYVREDDGSPWGNDYITGGDVLNRIVDVVDRDGHHDESPNYNQGKPEAIQAIAENLNGYDAYEGADLYRNVKVEKMHSALIRLVMLGRFGPPHIGDTSNTGDRDSDLNLPRNLNKAFQVYDDPIIAQALYLLNDNSVEGVEADIFTPDAGEFGDRIRAVIDAEGPLDLPSENLAGYGFTALRDGEIDYESSERDTRREFWTYYGRNYTSHNHKDTLNLGVFAHELNLAPDLGYPENTGDWPKRENWTENTISHNTVVVDEEKQHDLWVGEPRHFDATDRVKLIDVEAPDVYPQTDRYRRTTAMIRVDDERSYAVDVFRVAGGDEHVFSFHAAEGEVATSGLDLVPQESGTYAGEDVPKPAYGEDTEYNRSVGGGFNYLYDVERDDDPADAFTVDWDVEDTWDRREGDADDVRLRLTMLGDLDDVALADGNPPDRAGNPESLRYVLARRNGDGLESTFTSVIEPVEGDPAVESVTAVPVADEDGNEASDARAVRVDLATGRTDYVASALDADAEHTVDETFTFEGALAVYSTVDGASEYAYVDDGKLLTAEGDGRGPLLQRPQGRVEATVEDFTRELTDENWIDVKLHGRHTDLEELVGNWIYVDTDGERNGAYRIEDAFEETANLARLAVGDATTVQQLRDPERPEEGYVYLLEEGAAAAIPLSTTWKR